MRITTRKRETYRLASIVRDLERLVDEDARQARAMQHRIDLAMANYSAGQKAGARHVLLRYTGKI